MFSSHGLTPVLDTTPKTNMIFSTFVDMMPRLGIPGQRIFSMFESQIHTAVVQDSFSRAWSTVTKHATLPFGVFFRETFAGPILTRGSTCGILVHWLVTLYSSRDHDVSCVSVSVHHVVTSY